jgi:hypothetical protein
MRLGARIAARLGTVADLVRHFVRSGRFILVPLLLVLLIASGLLVLTEGLSFVAPFVYTLF